MISKTKRKLLSCPFSFMVPEWCFYYTSSASRQLLILAVAALTASQCAWCQAVPIITTIAGTDSRPFQGDGQLAANVQLPYIAALGVDPSGSIYALSSVVLKIGPDGVLHRIAGTGLADYSGDGGPAVDASTGGYGAPQHIAVDASGNIYLGTFFNTIRRITPDGIVDRYYLPPLPFGTNDVIELALGADGSLYAGNQAQLLRVFPDGSSQVLAGNGLACAYPCASSVDGQPAVGVPLQIRDVAVDPAGTVYIAESARIHKLGSDGILHTIDRTFDPIYQISCDLSGNLYVATVYDLLSVSPSGESKVLLRGIYPEAVVAGPQGDVYFASFYNAYASFQIYRLLPSGGYTAVAGAPLPPDIGDGGSALAATLGSPRGMAVEPDGSLLVVDQGTRRIRKISPDGLITSIAGNGVYGYATDGVLATSSALFGPESVAIDSTGNIYVADLSPLHRISPNGFINTVQVNGANPITAACGVAVDKAGNLYAGDVSGPGAVFKIDPRGNVTKIAGSGTQTANSNPPHGPAAGLALYQPCGLAVGSSGDLYVADFLNAYKIHSDGTYDVIAPGFNFGSPVAVALDSSNNIFIAGVNAHVVYRVDTSGTISKFVGNGEIGLLGDGGLAASAFLKYPSGLVFDMAGNLILSDDGTNRIRKVLAQPASIQISAGALTFAAQSGGAPAPPQSVLVTSSVAGISFSLSGSTASGRNWLRLSTTNANTPRLIDVSADPTGLAPGTYTGSVLVSSPFALTGSPVKVTFVVTQGPGPQLTVDKQSLSFTYPLQGAPRSQQIAVSNVGSGSLTFSAAVVSRSPWLTVSPVSGQVSPASPMAISVTSDPTNLPPGAYTGKIAITSGADQRPVAVTMTISSQSQAILLSQTGMSFTGVSQGGLVAPQSFRVMNPGSGIVTWTVSTSTLSGTPGWLNVDRQSGASDAAAATVPAVTVNVNAASLPEGTYYGLVRIDAPSAANTPQVVSVSLRVLKPGSNPGASVQPTELQFTTFFGGQSPSTQDILIYNPSSSTQLLRTSLSLDNGLTLDLLPAFAAVDPQSPTRMVVQPVTNSPVPQTSPALSPGVFNGRILLSFSDGRLQAVGVKVFVKGPPVLSLFAPSPRTGNAASSADTGPCTPGKLVPSVTSLSDSFAVSAGWPVALAVDVKDDCGNTFDGGSVTVAFSNGDPSLPLKPFKNGHWEATWPTGTKLSGVTLTVTASDPHTGISGQRQVTGALGSQTDPPAFDSSGVVAGYNTQNFLPVAPGGLITITGNRLAEDSVSSPVPLLNQLGGTQVLVAGILAPLVSVSQTQIQAILPFGVTPNTNQQILIQRGQTLSLPVQVDVASAQPAIAANMGYMDVPADGSAAYSVSQNTPAHAGDGLVFFCVGLGSVSQTVQDGYPGPSPAPMTNGAVQVNFNASLTPPAGAILATGLVGIYEITTTVPSNLPSGQATLTVTEAGQTSPAVTIPVQ